MPTCSVLVVDDEPLIRWSLRTHLERSGYSVVDAGTGGEALDRSGSGIDVALVDLRLPDTDGLRLVRELRLRHPGCPVILMTAYGTPEVSDAAQSAGVFRVVDKPFDLDALTATIEAALRSVSGAAGVSPRI